MREPVLTQRAEKREDIMTVEHDFIPASVFINPQMTLMRIFSRIMYSRSETKNCVCARFGDAVYVAQFSQSVDVKQIQPFMRPRKYHVREVQVPAYSMSDFCNKILALRVCELLQEIGNIAGRSKEQHNVFDMITCLLINRFNRGVPFSADISVGDIDGFLKVIRVFSISRDSTDEQVSGIPITSMIEKLQKCFPGVPIRAPILHERNDDKIKLHFA
jgi:hypothetical protein